MRTQLIAAAVGLGLSALIPNVAKADHDHYRESREIRHEPIRVEHEFREVRHIDRPVYVERPYYRDHIYYTPYVPVVVDPDFCAPVSVSQVPQSVLGTVYNQTGGAPIESIQYIRRAGVLFYDVQVSRPYGTHQVLRVGIDGSYLGCE